LDSCRENGLFFADYHFLGLFMDKYERIKNLSRAIAVAVHEICTTPTTYSKQASKKNWHSTPSGAWPPLSGLLDKFCFFHKVGFRVSGLGLAWA
jgi:hypothetical protein